MAVTVDNATLYHWPTRKFVTADVTFDDSYAEGGEALTPGDFGLVRIDEVMATNACATDGSATVAVTPILDSGTWKLVAGWTPALEIDDGQDIAAQALAEPADTTDLDAYTCKVWVVGA